MEYSTLVPGKVPQRGGWSPGGKQIFKNALSTIIDNTLEFLPGSGEAISAQYSRENFELAIKNFKKGEYTEGSINAVNSLIDAIGTLPIAHQAIIIGKKGAKGLGKMEKLLEAEFIYKKAKAAGKSTEELAAIDRQLWSTHGVTFGFADGLPRMEISDKDAYLRHSSDEIYDPRIYYQEKAAEYYVKKDSIGFKVQRGEMDKVEGRNIYNSYRKKADEAAFNADSYYTHGSGKASRVGEKFKVNEAVSIPGLKGYQELGEEGFRYTTKLPFEGTGSYGREGIEVSLMSDDPIGSALHEIQHGIQKTEGFASGGSPSKLSWVSAEQRPELMKAAKETFDNWKPASYKEFWGDDMSREGKAAYQTYLDKFNSEENISKRWLASQEGASGVLYKKLAGEAESRLVASRRKLSDAERRSQYPIDSFDIPVNQQVVRIKK